jgi:hypothetical protein
MNFLQIVNSYAGLVSMVFVLVGAFFTARYSGKSKASSTATDAQDKAMNAMEMRLNVQEKNISDLTKENMRLQLIIETISSALKGMNLVVTIEGELVRIKDENNNSSVTTRIHNQNGQ